MDKFNPPNFLGEGFQPKHEEMFFEGSVTSVRDLPELPPNILEKIPQLEKSATGYVVKQYNKADANFSKQDSVLVGSVDTKSLVGQQLVLKARQAALSHYLGEELPDIIVPSEFFVARNDSDDFAVYEIQPRLPEYQTLDTIQAAFIKKLNPRQREKLIATGRILLSNLRKLLTEENDPVFKVFVPDLNSTNIAITNTGDIKIFDTNYFGFRLSPSIPRKVEFAAKSLELLIAGMESGQI